MSRKVPRRTFVLTTGAALAGGITLAALPAGTSLAALLPTAKPADAAALTPAVHVENVRQGGTVFVVDADDIQLRQRSNGSGKVGSPLMRNTRVTEITASADRKWLLVQPPIGPEGWAEAKWLKRAEPFLGIAQARTPAYIDQVAAARYAAADAALHARVSANQPRANGVSDREMLRRAHEHYQGAAAQYKAAWSTGEDLSFLSGLVTTAEMTLNERAKNMGMEPIVPRQNRMTVRFPPRAQPRRRR